MSEEKLKPTTAKDDGKADRKVEPGVPAEIPTEEEYDKNPLVRQQERNKQIMGER